MQLQAVPSPSTPSGNGNGNGNGDGAGSELEEAVGGLTENVSEGSGALLAYLSDLDSQTLWAVGAGGAVFALLYLVRWGLGASLKRLAGDDPTAIPAILARIVGRFGAWFFAAVALYTGLMVGGAPDEAVNLARFLLIVAAIVQVASVAQEFALSLLRRSAHSTRRGHRDQAALNSAINVLKWFINVAIWSVALLLILDNVGIDVTAMVAGLGIGGIAIGFAAQGVFRDLFAALSIILDKPFRKGDFISTDGILGTVEEIGMKTTRIRALSGEQLVIGNNQLLELTIQNYGRMRERRVVVPVSVTYQTSPDKLREGRRLLQRAVEETEDSRFDRCNLCALGASSLDFELVFWVNSPDYARYMELQEMVLMGIIEAFHGAGIEFAYPTRTLHLAAPDGTGVDLREIVREAA